jgi:hypothetical protein
METTKIWSWVPVGPNTNNCAGEGQKKFTGLDWERRRKEKAAVD